MEQPCPRVQIDRSGLWLGANVATSRTHVAIHRPAGSLTELMFRRPSEALNEIYSHYLPIGLKPPEQR